MNEVRESGWQYTFSFTFNYGHDIWNGEAKIILQRQWVFHYLFFSSCQSLLFRSHSVIHPILVTQQWVK